MNISDWRKQIDDLDRKLVELLNQRATAAIGIYEPQREREVIENVQKINAGPLAGRDLAQIYERIMDVMRSIQKHEIVPEAEPASHGTEIDSKLED